MGAHANPIPFAQRLHTLLEEQGRSQASLAEISGLERSTISRLIRGERSPTLETLQYIAPALGIDVAMLVAGTDAESRIGGASDVVRREDFEAAVHKLAEYEAHLNDCAMKLEAAHDSARRERARRDEAESALLVAHRDLERTRADWQELMAERTRLHEQLKQYRDALHKAVGEVSTLRLQVTKLATELKATSNSSRTAALLAGVAAVTGVVTAATFLGGGDKAVSGSARSKKTGKRTGSGD